MIKTSPHTKYGEVGWLLVSHKTINSDFHKIQHAVQSFRQNDPTNEAPRTDNDIISAPPKDTSKFSAHSSQLTEPEETELWYKVEGFILAVCCKTLADAQLLIEIGRKAGLKRCSITSTLQEKVLVLIVDTQRIETLVGKNGKILLREDYLRLMVALGDKKLEKSRKKLSNLADALQSYDLF